MRSRKISYAETVMLGFPCETCGARAGEWCTQARRTWLLRRWKPGLRMTDRLHPNRFFQANRAGKLAVTKEVEM